MSILARLLARLGKHSPSPRPVPRPDCMSIPDWADLPVHHPSCKTC